MAWLSVLGAIACVVARFMLASRRTVDVTGLLYVLQPFHAAAFALRRCLPLRARPLRHSNEDKARLFSYAGDDARSLEKRERVLRKRYDLGALSDASSRDVYRENLYVIDALDRFVDGNTLGRRVRALDVGSKDFRYATALARWLGHAGTRSPREVSLTGIELEGHRLHPDLRTRRDHAEAFAAEVGGAIVTYEVADFLARDEREVDVVFMLFPFVLEYALVRWGLPRSFFLPDRMLACVKASLRPGGLVVIFNHTEEERARQQELLTEAGFEIVSSDPLDSDLVDYASDLGERSITVARAPR